MPIFRKGDVSILFIHVPKTGGTSIEDLFISSGWEAGLLDRGSKPSFNYHRRCSPQHMHAALLAENLKLNTFQFTFMVVREPIARFRSELVMRRPALREPWSVEMEQFALSLLRNSSANPYISDNHVRPQHEFYVPGAAVFHLEDGLESMAATLRDDHGFDLDLSNGVPREKSRTGDMPSGSLELPAHLERNVTQFYWEDFIRFGYSAPAHPRSNSNG